MGALSHGERGWTNEEELPAWSVGDFRCRPGPWLGKHRSSGTLRHHKIRLGHLVFEVQRNSLHARPAEWQKLRVHGVAQTALFVVAAGRQQRPGEIRGRGRRQTPQSARLAQEEINNAVAGSGIPDSALMGT